MKEQKLSLLFKLIILLTCYASFGAWFLLGIKHITSIVAFVYITLYYFTHTEYFHFSRHNNVWFFLLFIAVTFTSLRLNFNGIIYSWLSVASFFYVFNLKPSLKSDLFSFISRITGVILSLSLVWYCLFLIGIQLPYNHLDVVTNKSGEIQYEYDNYYLFILRTNNIFDTFLFPRFSYIFYEPGYVGCLMALLLFVKKYNLRKHKENIIFLIALLFTFSLAGWLIATLGYILYSLKVNKHRLSWIISISVFVFLFVSFFHNYNDGDNLINMGILQRLEFNDSSGYISGYNRSSQDMRDYFWNNFYLSPESLFGKPNANMFFDSDATDWMSFVIRYGWASLVAFLFFVFSPFLYYKEKKYELVCLSVLYTLIFSQTIFLIYSFMYLTIFSLGVNEILSMKE